MKYILKMRTSVTGIPFEHPIYADNDAEAGKLAVMLIGNLEFPHWCHGFWLFNEKECVATIRIDRKTIVEVEPR